MQYSIAPSGGCRYQGISSFTFTFDVRTSPCRVGRSHLATSISTSTSARIGLRRLLRHGAARVSLDEPLDGFDATTLQRSALFRFALLCSRRRAASRCCRASSSYRATSPEFEASSRADSPSRAMTLREYCRVTSAPAAEGLDRRNVLRAYSCP